MKFLDELRAAVAAKLAQRDALTTELEAVLAKAADEKRSALTADEDTKFAELRAAVIALDTDIDRDAERRDQLEAEEKRAVKVAEIRASLGEPDRTVGGAQVINEARTYRPDSDHSYVTDLYHASRGGLGNPNSLERIQRHARENELTKEFRVAINAGAMAGAIPPKFLTDQFAPIARAGRPFLNSLNSMSLPPDGMVFNIPRGTTGATAGQSAENAVFSDSTMANTDVTNRVELTTSTQPVSLATVLRGGPVVDQVLFPDLVMAVETLLNNQCINGTGVSPQHRGLANIAGLSTVSYTDATPTVPELWPKLSDAIQRINSLRFAPGTVIVMHPRRWGWITSALDSVGRPAFEFSLSAPNSVLGLGQAAAYGQIVGSLQGLPVITDASIGTTIGAGTEDEIYVVRSFDILFWEDAPMQFSFEQTAGPQTVNLSVGKFALFVAGRYPQSISQIRGTGLIAPTF
jgi:HK97 family phage major capsid protein